MKFFFDESGDFAIPSSADDHRAAVVMGVAVSENIGSRLGADFEDFKRGLSASEVERGEPKGRSLSVASVNRFCDLLDRYTLSQGISLTPVSLDLASLVGTDSSGLSDRLSATIQRNAELCVFPEMRNHVELLSRQFGNLSNPQALRAVCLASCLHEAIDHALVFLSGREHDTAWTKLEFVIDAVQTKSGSRDSLVFSQMVLMWLAAWSRSRPFTAIKEIHTPDHPIEKLYGLKDGIDLGKMLRGNLHWRSSRESWGLQIADIAASITYGALTNLQGGGYVQRFARMMKLSAYAPQRGPGLIVLDGVRDSFLVKYRVLCHR